MTASLDGLPISLPYVGRSRGRKIQPGIQVLGKSQRVSRFTRLAKKTQSPSSRS